MFAMGVGIIAISVEGRAPGYGILSMYLVFCLNLSIMSYGVRALVVVFLIITYLIGIYIFDHVRACSTC